MPDGKPRRMRNSDSGRAHWVIGNTCLCGAAARKNWYVTSEKIYTCAVCAKLKKKIDFVMGR